ncbi:hypothetical protein [Actinacidiphila acididurans]|uniref:Papain family cysteine protease n=1 Tax=Actinacidiphila acididurans TaxID=2784346 RepID=A0ABS2U319_9ACTN|nr:hypothetical protein [Actinacidiphila acididurans]MBM9510000.1 hypothetical protein [Actinacidiphila acididurans]
MHVQLLNETSPLSGRRLGRHIEHDPRSLAYAHGVLPKSAIKSVSWTRRIPILNQGNIGSCTGNAETGALGTDSVGRTAAATVTVKADSKGVFTAGIRTLDETFALDVYTLNTLLDSIKGNMPGDDTGSTSLACGKSGQALGLFSGYTHAYSYDALLSALQSGPVLIGIPWYNSMFEPQADGRIVVDVSSGLAGGHEMVVREYDLANDEVWPDNSWDTTWGLQGRGYFAGADLRTLLANGGDVLVPAFTASPAPAPTPTPVPAGVTGAQVAAAVRGALTGLGV